MKTYNKKNIARFESRNGRKIVVDGVRWIWQIPNNMYGGRVLMYSENGDRVLVADHEIKGICPDTYVDNKWNQNLGEIMVL